MMIRPAAAASGGPVDQRIRRRNRRLFGRAAIGYLVVWVLAGILLPDKGRLVAPPGVVTAWSSVTWLAAAALACAGMVLLVRRRPRQTRSRVLDALDERQRQELVDELRGRRPVVAGDEPVLERMARERASLRHVALLMAAVVLALVPAEVADPGGVVGAARLLFAAGFGVWAVALLEQARDGARYVDGRSPSG